MPNLIAEITIRYDDVGHITISAPKDKILAYGMLEMGKELVMKREESKIIPVEFKPNPEGG